MKLLNTRYLVGILTLLFSFNATAQIINTVAGNGTAGYSGDGGSANSAELNIPTGVAVDASGNLFIADQNNNVIRKVSTSGVITTVAGNSTVGYSGDGGSATSAELNYPWGVAVDASGNLFISDKYNNRIRKVSPNGVITTVAGNGTYGYSGDGGSATSAKLAYPFGLAVDASGNLFIAEVFNNVIRKVSTSGVITTVAGNGFGAGTGNGGYSGDGGSATAAELSNPNGVAVDASGNLFIADNRNSRIRKVSNSGVITTVAGNGIFGYSGDGGSATAAELSNPNGVAVDASGNLFIADEFNNRIRKVSTSGVITTVAGNGYKDVNGNGGYSGDGGSAIPAELNSPTSVVVDASGNLFISDEFNNRIRKVIGGALLVKLANITAIQQGKSIQTIWHTSAELNTSHFIIQHSTDGKSFTDIGTVKAIGSGANGYQFTDNNPTPYPLNGVLYYRLKIVDKDGSFSFSKIVSVQLTIDNYQLSISPNPSKDKVMVKGNHIVSVQVLDNLGRVIKTQALKDATNPTLSVVGLPVGAYHLRVQTTDGKVSAVAFVKK